MNTIMMTDGQLRIEESYLSFLISSVIGVCGKKITKRLILAYTLTYTGLILACTLFTTTGLILACTLFGITASKLGKRVKAFTEFFETLSIIIIHLLNWVIW